MDATILPRNIAPRVLSRSIAEVAIYEGQDAQPGLGVASYLIIGRRQGLTKNRF